VSLFEGLGSVTLSAPEAEVREIAAAAFVARADALEKLGDIDGALGAYDHVVEWFADAPEANRRGWVAVSLWNKSRFLARLGRSDEAALQLQELVDRFGDEDTAATAWYVDHARAELESS
jgi:hypothetical protein